jgi:regulator of sigma E protease
MEQAEQIMFELIAALFVAIPSFLVLLTIIVFFHEYGHFFMARLLGVRVEVFSIGFGKPLARWVDRKGTEWRIAMIPLGGYVKFFGDADAISRPEKRTAKEPHPATTQFPPPGHEDEVARTMTPAERKVCFHFKPVWARALIVGAGPFANFVLAVAIFFGLLTIFGDYVSQPRIAEVLPGSAAEEAGFMPGDLVTAVNGRRIRDFDDLSIEAKLGAGETLVITVERDGETLTLTASPRRAEMEDAFGNTVIAGQLGVRGDPSAGSFVRYSPSEALGESARRVWRILSATTKFLGRLLVGKEDIRQIGGPIKMAQYAGAAASSGFEQESYAEPPDFLTQLKVSLATFVYLAAVVSVSIGFLNLLPVPVLDGGHLMYYAYEAIARKPLGAKAQAIGFRVGLVLLASLMLFVTWNDISNLLSLAG